MSVAQDTEAVSGNNPSGEDLMARARSLVPMLANKADECEALGRTPDQTIQAFEDAGFFRILQPAKYGGYEYFPTVFYNVVMELAKGCPSSAWSLAILGIHSWEPGLCDPRIAEDLWGEDSTVRFSSSYAPFGTANKVDGGFILDGRWSWSSGCDHASWVILGAVAEKEDGETAWLAFFLPRTDYRIDQDSWDTSGMRGTGSKDVIVDRAFVPAYRIHDVGEAINMTDPGRATFTADTYKISFGVVFTYALASVALGIADAALEHSIEVLRRRTSAYDGSAFRQDPPTQKMLAEAHSLIDSAHLKMDRDFTEMAGFIESGEDIPLDRRIFYRWHAAEIPRMAKDAVNLLIEGSGGTSFLKASPMQRYFRDVNCMANHQALNYEKGVANFGYNLLTGGNLEPLV